MEFSPVYILCSVVIACICAYVLLYVLPFAVDGVICVTCTP